MARNKVQLMKRLIVLMVVFAVFVLAFGATSVETQSTDDSTSKLSPSQRHLIETLARKAEKDALGPKLQKRGYMNLITELSREGLGKVHVHDSTEL
jgi:hypothetical protein